MTNKIRVKMLPHVSQLAGESGVNQVVINYTKFLPEFGIRLVKPDAKHKDYDLIASHAGNTGSDCDVAHLHGMYWTADYPGMGHWAWRVNANIAEAIRHAKEITVPSAWVAETIQRDVRKNPHIVPHGIEWQEWQHNEPNEGYVLWNKNRIGIDVCDNSIIIPLADAFDSVQFLLTFPPIVGKRNNIHALQLSAQKHNKPIPHKEMKKYVQRAGVYLSTTKETWGIGVLEAMASGVPVVGWDLGGNSILIEHGVNGYLATPNDFDDLCEGLKYCFKYRKQLGANGIELAKKWTWQNACQMVADVYRLALENEKPTVSVVIPVYNKPKDEIERTIDSALNQTLKPKDIIIVDDGSTDNCAEDVIELYKPHTQVKYIRQHNQGVAEARNNGIRQTNSKYICCLDSDDWIEPNFLEICINELEQDNSLGIAYTGLMAHIPDKEPSISDWPSDFNYNEQIKKHNQIPTCCVFRCDAWERVGGYRSRYCPQGAGSEDAAFWTAIGAIGYNAKKVTDKPLFNYSFTTGMASGNPNYREVDWLQFYPWTIDGQHPFVSIATPGSYSHAVRQYDEPLISVIIPVGPGHEKEVINALDSLEMQHFRKWEVIVIDDTGDGTEGTEYENREHKAVWINLQNELDKSFPYVRWLATNHVGAGAARNRGIDAARGDLLFFLDADDMLTQANSLDLMLAEFNKNQGVIYSDYLGKAVWDKEEAQKAFKKDLLHYNDKSQVAVFKKQSADFDCTLAQKQPLHKNDNRMPYYHWCLISVLVPRAWHYEIGGFDETLTTWEDVDYLWRLAKYGHCFYRVQEPLVLYNYHKGNRRELSAVNDDASLQSHQKMIQYITSKYERIENVVCNCGKRQEPKPIENGVDMSADNFILIELHFPGEENRNNFGRPLKSPTHQIGSDGRVLDYHGYSRKSGDRFLVHKLDQQARPDMFRLVPEEVKVPKVKKVELPKPKPIKKVEPVSNIEEVVSILDRNGVLDLMQLPRMTSIIEQRMIEAKLTTKQTILDAGIDGLTQIKGIGQATAKKIIEYLQK